MEGTNPANPAGSRLSAAVCEVMKEVGAVLATGETDRAAGGYRYASDVDLARALQPAMAKHGLSLSQADFVSVATVEHGKSRHGNTVFRSDVVIRYKLAHVSGEEREIVAAGSGTDTMDKGVYKAQTGALKYALRTAFLIPTPKTEADLDPDATPSGDGVSSSRRDASTSKSRPPVRTSTSTSTSKPASASASKVEWAADKQGRPVSYACPEGLSKCPRCGGKIYDNRGPDLRKGSPHFRCANRKGANACGWAGWIPEGGASQAAGASSGSSGASSNVEASLHDVEEALRRHGFDPDAVNDWGTEEKSWPPMGSWKPRDLSRFLSKLNAGELVPPDSCKAGPDFDYDDIPF